MKLTIIIFLTVLLSGCVLVYKEKQSTQAVQGEPKTYVITQEEVKPQEQPVVMEVRIKNLQFLPRSMNIPKATKVEWVNEDDAEHTVTFDSLSIDAKIPKGGAFSYTFNEPGTFDYRCSFHPGMTGTIIVE